MEIILKKKPKSVTLIEGFPGFGLVGTIATEFLIDHLETEQIGKIAFEEVPALVAIHDGKVVEPMGIFHSKKYNITLLHAVSATQGFEWELAKRSLRIATELTAKEIISLEGVGSASLPGQEKVFYFASDRKNAERFKAGGISPLTEGIIIGVTGALLLHSDSIPFSCVFAETHANMPDSKSAAAVIEVLDKYLDLKVNTKPLLERAVKFEEKLRDIMLKSQQTAEASDK